MSYEIWNNFSTGIWNYAVDAYSNMEPWTYPLFFLGIIGYVYTATHSVTALVASIIGTFALYATTTTIFADVPDLSLFLNIVSIVGISALIFTLVMRKVVRQ
jgi:hypothetical protein